MMNIHTVRDNLKNTIAGKELFLQELERSRTEQTDQAIEIATTGAIQMLTINIDELKRILADVELCCEKDVADS